MATKQANQYANDILNAVATISQQRIKQANFDKTVIATVKQCSDKSIGKYIINYKDIDQEAYAINADMKYDPGQMVYVLFPGNNSQRVKTIINTVDHIATVTDNVKTTDELYNQVGPNLANLGSTSKTNIKVEDGIIKLFSYKPLELDNNNSYLYKKGASNNIITIDSSLYKYLKQGDSIILSAKLKTSIVGKRQAYGQYGVKVICNFYENGQDGENVNKSSKVQKEYFLSNFDVYGFPYSVTTKTPIKHLEIIDSKNFIDIESIQAYCYDFQNTDQSNWPKDSTRPDIVFYDFAIQAANILTAQESNGYSLYLNCSEKGDSIKTSISEISLKAELKISGKLISDNIRYYWFRQNGTVFKANSKWSEYGGDGWECLNDKKNKKFIGAKSNTLRFVEDPSTYKTNNLKNVETITTQPIQKVLKIKCVSVYNENIKTEGIKQVYNEAVTNDIVIESSDRAGEENRVNYYFNNGSPTLKCIAKIDGNQITKGKYYWSIDYGNGQTEQLVSQDKDITFAVYNDAKDKYEEYLKEQKKVEKTKRESFKNTDKNKKIIDNWNNVKNKQIVDINENQLINLNIGKIKKSATITCGVSQGNGDSAVYIGSASITLYNSTEVKDGYSLVINNGIQVYQYNGDGISPIEESNENKFEITPLSFALFDNEGREISYAKIKANGFIRWCIPKTNTLLIDQTGSSIIKPLDYNGMKSTDRALAANDTYSVYENLQTFSYSIAPTFDYTKTNNNIRLYVQYKDMIFDQWTNFTFPKSGDPGTNGTKYYAKIFPLKWENGASTDETLISDRVYIDSNGKHYDDQGRTWRQLKAILYNGSKETGEEPAFWNCPIASGSAGEQVKDRGRTSHFTKNEHHSQWIDLRQASKNFQLDVVNAQFRTGEDIKYFAQFPICYVHTIVEGDNSKYRIKIRQKTGYSYVVYAEDGTRPQHENSSEFEVFVEELQDFKVGESTTKYYIEKNISQASKFTWTAYGNFKEGYTKHGNKVSIQPAQTFDGQIGINSIKVVIDVGESEKIEIHIPVVMYINRYGHKTLNDWDGHSIELGDNVDGMILAPQVGAGRKDKDTNTFTGVLMGQIKYSNSDKSNDVGLFGYDKGARTIFLDAQTGKAQFGKNNAGKIIIDPRLKIGISTKTETYKDAGLLYSNNYTLPTASTVINSTSYVQLDVSKHKPGDGMIIDLSTPQIGFGSGNFYVTEQGNIHSQSGDIGGWRINPNSLSSSYFNTGEDGTQTISGVWLRSKADSPDRRAIEVRYGQLTGSSTTDSPSASDVNQTKRIFSVDYAGSLYSEKGEIAGWNITPSSLYKSKVGMNSIASTDASPATVAIAIDNTTQSKAFFANGDNFYVTHDGYLKSKYGKISSWDIGADALTNGRTGLGNMLLTTGMQNLDDTAIQAVIWSSSTENKGFNFAVDENGKLYSKAGKIGGWNITSNSLKSKNSTKGSIEISSDGTITGEGDNYRWQINNEGKANFNQIDASGGKIGNWSITNGALTGNNGNVKLTSAGNIIANGGTIGGWTLSSSTIKGGDVILQSDGTLTGSSWGITSGGQANFNKLTGSIDTGGSLSGAGMTFGGGGGVSPGEDGYIPSNINLNQVTADGTTTSLASTFGTIIADKIEAERANIETLITTKMSAQEATIKEATIKELVVTKNFSFNGKKMEWKGINVPFSLNVINNGPFLIPTSIDSTGRVTSYQSVNSFVSGVSEQEVIYYLSRSDLNF